MQKIIISCLLLCIISIPNNAFAVTKIYTEIEIAEQANRIKKMGWELNQKYKMARNGNVCVSAGKNCYNLFPIQIAKTRAGRSCANSPQIQVAKAKRDKCYSYYYGSSIMSKMLMEFMIGRRIPFTSGHRPDGVGSNRHHTNGAAYAFDMKVLGGSRRKVAVAAAWKYATQMFGVPASVGMKYAKSPSMVHLDTKPIGGVQKYSWGWGGSTNAVGKYVLSFYGRTRQTKMPYETLVGALKGKIIKAPQEQQQGTSTGMAMAQSQPYRSWQAQQYAQQYGVNNNANQFNQYYRAVPVFGARGIIPIAYNPYAVQYANPLAPQQQYVGYAAIIPAQAFVPQFAPQGAAQQAPQGVQYNGYGTTISVPQQQQFQRQPLQMVPLYNRYTPPQLPRNPWQQAQTQATSTLLQQQQSQQQRLPLPKPVQQAELGLPQKGGANRFFQML